MPDELQVGDCVGFAAPNYDESYIEGIVVAIDTNPRLSGSLSPSPRYKVAYFNTKTGVYATDHWQRAGLVKLKSALEVLGPNYFA